MKVTTLVVLSLLLFLPLAYSGCPALQFNPQPKIIDSKIYVVPGTVVTAPDCGDYVHSCSNTGIGWKTYPHYITITGSPNKDFFVIEVKEENITISKEKVLNAIKSYTYKDILFDEVQPFEIELNDIPSLDDIQGTPSFIIDCNMYNTSTSLNFTYVPELEKKIHRAVENFAKRINNTQKIESSVRNEGNLTINMTLITTIKTNLISPSTAYDKLTITTIVKNITNITNITNNESMIEESENETVKYYYVNYERIFSKFYTDGNIKTRIHSEICGVRNDVYVSKVTSYKFEREGTYYIYGSSLYIITVR